MNWFEKWKNYTGYDKVHLASETATNAETDNELVDELEKLHVHKEADTKELPGEINDENDLEQMLLDDPFLKHPNDYFENRYLKTSLKEDEDFVILPEEAWQYLYDIYGGTDIPRLSIEVAHDDETPNPEYMIEIYFKRIFIYIYPKVKNHLCLKKPSSLFISRRATVVDLRKRIAEIL